MIKVRDITLGEGIPAICVPLTGATVKEVLVQAEQAALSEADIAEWRADLCGEVMAGTCGIPHVIREIRERLGDKALLFTVRTKKEGGAADIDEEAYKALLEEALKEAPGIDMIDIELSAGEAAVSELIAEAKRAGVVTVISSHDFEKTPEDPELEALAEALDKTGGDIAKIAVMPNSPEDVERIRALADKIKNGLMKKPYLLISMGETGKETRLDAGALGSVMTFGALTEKQLSAPGQVTVSELKKELLRRSRL